MFDRIDVDAAHEVLKERLSAYFGACRAETLDAYAVAPKTVFDAYFAGATPFGGGEKKAEFPDAFNVAALRAWAAKASKTTYVVSDDGDLKAACSNGGPLIYASKIEEVISIAQAEHDLLQRLEIGIRRLQPDLLKFLERTFPDRGFILEDQNGDVDDVQVVDFEMGDVFVIDRRGDWFEVEVTGSVRFSGTATYDDMHTATWDSEDRVAIPWRTTSREIDQEEYVTLAVEVSMDDEGDLDVLSQTITTPRDVYVVAEPYETFK
jgi:hypothetical protein